MSFASLSFLVFAAFFFAAWPWAKRSRSGRDLYLVLCSAVFYGWADRRLLLILFPLALLVFLLALAVDRADRRRKLLFVAALTLVLGDLAFFKYRGFLSETAARILTSAGIPAHAQAERRGFFHLLPLGISFYTFQGAAYLIDVYRRQMPACRNPLRFLAWFSLFPNLIAGPILRARQMLPQLEGRLPSAEPQRWEGMCLIAVGFFKKAVIADNLVPDIAQAFGAATPSHATLFWWSVVAAYALQIYFDFSGYSDIARGLLRWIGLETPLNFNHPYRARSISDFWSRWHMTLSLWFRDYLFLPLSYALMRHIDRDRFLKIKVEVWVYSLATAATMLLCGLWHGPAWNFVLWGGAYGVFLIIERTTRWPRRLKKLPGGGTWCVALTLVQVWTAWVLFRAENLPQAWAILKALFSWRGGAEWGLSTAGTWALLLGLAVEARSLVTWRPRPERWRELQPVFGALFVAALIFLALLFRGPGGAFVYFKF
jgi:alginate O-acetyltransferase complex protein AlgI